MNEVVYCEHCNQNLYTMLRERKSLDKVEPEDIKPIPPQQMPGKGFVNCAHCGGRIGFFRRKTKQPPQPSQ